MADNITFTTLQLLNTLTPATAPNVLGPQHVGTTTTAARRAFVGLMNDDGDGELGAGQSAYVLGGQNNQSRLQSLGTLNTAADPVLITAHGRTGGSGNAGAVGSFTDLTRVGFNKDWGFGIDNGPNTDTRFMDLGDALTFELTPSTGVQQRLTTVAFTIDTGGAAGTAELGLDFDGRLIRTGTYSATQTAANAEALLRLPGVQHNDRVVIDFVNGTLTVNGTARESAAVDDFFAAYASSPHNKITIGNIGAIAAGTPGFSLKALSIGRDDFAGPPPNDPPSLTLTPVGTQPLDFGANSSGPVTVATIAIADDGIGLNRLNLAGADAQFFEIVGTELRLKAGMAVFTPQLEVSVVVDDASIGTTPEDTETFNVGFAGTNDSTLSFGLVQLASLPGQTAAQTVVGANNKVLGVGDVAASGTNTGTQWRVLTAMFGDGDTALEAGESGYVVSGAAGSNQLANLALNTAADPVLISAHGRVTGTNINAITSAAMLGFNNSWGFGIDNGPDGNNRLLNNGDSYTFELTNSGGRPQQFTRVSFVVDRSGLTNPNALVDVALDVDGNVINSTGTASPGAANALLRLSVAGGSTVVIDFAARTVNGQQQAAFFAAFDASPHNKLTIGSIAAGTQNNAGFSMGQLKIDRADYTPSANGAPTAVTLTPVPGGNAIAENADTAGRIKVADVAVTDDATGNNVLTVSGADAALFEVDATGLYLKAGVVLDSETKAQLQVTVSVNDPAVGGNPDATSQVFVIDVTDVDEFNVGPVTDTNAQADTVGSAAAAGTVVAITASAQDADRTNNAITYSLVNPDGQFAIDPVTGGVSVAGPLTAGNQTITVRATSADASFSDQAFTIDVVAANQPLGPVSSDQDPAANMVAENAAAGTLVGITALAVDPNPTDTVTYSVNDNRFAVGANGVVTVAGPIDAEQAGESITVTVTASSSDGSPAQSRDFTIIVTDVDEFDVGLIGDADGAANSVAWNAAAGTHVGYTASAADADRTTNAITYSLDNNDGGRFAIDSAGGQVTVASGVLLPSGAHTIAVRATSADGSFTSQNVTITVEPPVYGPITLDGQLGAAEWTPDTQLGTGAGYAVYGTYRANAFVLAISSDTAAIGAGTTVWFNTDLNRNTGFQVFGAGSVGAEYNINFGADGHAKLYTGNAGQTFVADLAYGRSADGHGLEVALPSTLLQGTPRTTELALDVNDTTFLPSDFARPYKIGAATIALTPVLTEALRETASTAQSIKVADIAVTAPGAFELVKSGPNAGFFDIVQGANGWELHLKAGTPLDFEAHSQGFGVTIGVDDLTSGGPLDPPEATASVSVAIADVDESQGSITLDGSLGEWGASTRLDAPANGEPNFAVYGTYEKAPVDAFVLAIQAPTGVEIGANTTIWFDTDLNVLTGEDIFDFPGVRTGGAEYNINFGLDGTASLYTGNAGQTLVAGGEHLDYFFNAARNVLEIALPSSLIGNARHANVYFDVNNSTFLPTDYANVRYLVEEKNVLPEDPTTRIAIVYSETTAGRFFDRTAYGQLFMSAQHQAMQAGIPFDVISESELTSLANLTNAQGQLKYDAFVFPSFSNVQSSQLSAITDTLTRLVNDYDVGLITMGDFLTNDQNGAALSGNAYARMQSLLGVTAHAFGNGSSLVLRASDTSHPVSDRYSDGEGVGTYNIGGYAAYEDITGSGRTLFTQQVGGVTEAAVIATTQGGGRHVHFASDALMGNNNILSEAIDWSARGGEPGNPISVGLQMTRGSSIFFSRNDMDQAQEYFDVVQTEPGIYDTLLPILQDWHQRFGFVGSYYVDIGADAPDQQTDWSVSGPFYRQLLEMGNEIGTHSYSHPSDTNLLLRNTFTAAQWSAWINQPDLSAQDRALLQGLTAAQAQDALTTALARTNPTADPGTFQAIDRAILKASYQFQFEYSRLMLEQQLGVNIDGGAVPGAPEKRPATDAIMQHLEYLTGGAALVGAGYPGAFGFVDPAHQDKVYFAPNASFDFTLVGFQGLTTAQAEAKWLQEYNNIVSKGTTPIIHWPWHDYGATEWALDAGGADPDYQTEMFTRFIERAYNQGTEFVTGVDLAQRIESFVRTNVEISQVGGEVVAHVSGGSQLGKFALDVDTNQEIAVVEDWYAYDGNKVFLATSGRTNFEITLGNQEADVTRIAKLPMRAELLQANGNGTDLAFNFRGAGDVVVDLKSGGGAVAQGADTVAMNGQLMTLGFSNLGPHNVTIDHQGGAAAAVALAALAIGSAAASGLSQVTGTAGDDFVFGSDQGMRIDGGRGSDQLYGGDGDDEFVFGAGRGAETVLDFTLAEDRIALVNSGFTSVVEARAAFSSQGNDLRLSLSAADTLLLKDVALADLTADHIVLDSLIS